MKKIHNLNDLRQEQELLEQRKLQLEKELQRDWNDLRQNLSRQSNSLFGELTHNYASGLLPKALGFAAEVASRKFGGKIGSKVYNWFK